MTALDLIKQALYHLNVMSIGDSLGNDEAQDCLTVLNMLLDNWNNQNLALYYNTDETFTATDSSVSYSIGSGATWDTDRPLQITSAFIRTNGIDYPLKSLTSEEYNAISDKTTESTIPETYYYQPAYPDGTVFLWPVPSENTTVGLSQLKLISQISSLTSDLSFPNGYLLALSYNLAAELAPRYGKDAIAVRQMANKTLADIKRTNTRPLIVPLDRYARGRSTYNIYSDQYRY